MRPRHVEIRRVALLLAVVHHRVCEMKIKRKEDAKQPKQLAGYK